MWYQLSEDELYLVIGACRCRSAVIEDALCSSSHKPRDPESLRREMVQLSVLADRLYDAGSFDIPGVSRRLADGAAKYGVVLSAPRKGGK